MNLEPRRGPVFALLCDKQSGALELGLPVEFACSRVVWPQLSVYGQLLRAEMVKDGQALSLQVMSVADNGVSHFYSSVTYGVILLFSVGAE